MIHVCFSIFDEAGTFSKFTGTAMLSLFDNTNSGITVHVFHDKTLTQENRNKFSYLVGRYNQAVKFYNVEELFADRLAEIKNLFPNLDKIPFNKAALYKFFIPQALPDDIGKAIYLESNVIVNMDISNLWHVELGDKMLAAVGVNSIDPDFPLQDKIVADGFVKKENYFNAGVLLMNLKLLRGEEEKISEGIKFAAEHNYINFLDQTVLNYCFSTQALNLPVKFNRSTQIVRLEKESPGKKIYHYAGGSFGVGLGANMDDFLNRLWLSYFIKTPLFSAESLGRLYEQFQKNRNEMKDVPLKIAAIMPGKMRAFFIEPAKLKTMTAAFAIKPYEEVILAENEKSLKQLIEAMKTYKGMSVFFILTEKFLKKKFPIELLQREGFTEDKDFVKAWNFLPDAQGVKFDSYSLLKTM